ncbi:L,D-transpeptidase [Nodosilinea sp. E11]|uniref:L,D-transpeptidase n=1 Tax=Nodosilinea sp. E11 TaxID=3037479 RepID=UPI0029347734|nr:L,D-transpeptidase [Nodosilinea sp. E11]WOD37894.1 L,D-transpeptidase [Nodosilinea sp. E11]
MLNRLFGLSGLALALSLIVPAAQQARSRSLPEAMFSFPETNLVSDFAALTPESVLLSPIPEPAQAWVNPSVADTALAMAPPPQTEEVRLEIHLGQREVWVYQGTTITKRYPIGIGRAGWETPTGTFQVRQMRENPTWISPFTNERIPSGDARNPLGTRWIGFWTDGNNWIGFHGTRNPSTVGRNASHGCIHMHSTDLEDLYRQVKLGTSVTVVQ